MKYDIPEEVTKIINIFQENNFEIYIVGGAVRDLLVGRKTYDWDLTTNATPDEMLKILPDSYYTNDFGTVGIKPIVEGERPIEITTYRTEKGYSDNRRPDEVSWGKSLEEDLKRRDFTINALAIKPNGEIVDLFNGKKDLENKLVRAVGNPVERFNEDALRMMRAVRIASELGFTIEDETFKAIQSCVPLINKIARERIKDELFKLLKSEFAYEGVLFMKNSGLMDEILPELSKTFGVEQKSPNRHHIYDVGTHLLMSLKNCSSRNPVTRFATLIHDIGKPQTMKVLDSGVITFYNHEMVSTKIARNIAERMRFSNEEKDLFIKLVRFHQFTVSEHQTDSAIKRFLRNVGVENVEEMLALRTADRLGSGAKITSWRLEDFKKKLVEVQKQPFSVRDLKIDGTDVMKILGIPPSKKVGEVLEAIFAKVDSQELPNEREVLLKEIKLNQ